jgi:hypothetical protein
MSRAPQFIFAGVLIWASFLAAGAYLGPAKDRGITYPAATTETEREAARKRELHQWGRAALVSGCATAFVMFWAGMLLARRKRLERERHEDEDQNAAHPLS